MDVEQTVIKALHNYRIGTCTDLLLLPNLLSRDLESSLQYFNQLGRHGAASGQVLLSVVEKLDN